MPRRRLCITLPPALARRLEEFVAAKGGNMSGVIEEAIDKHLGGDHNWDVLFRRLDRHSRALTRLQRDLDISLEAFGGFVQLWLGHTPEVPPSEQPARRREALERYQRFRVFVARELAGGRRFVDDLAKPLEVQQAQPAGGQPSPAPPDDGAE